jgi:D-alanyl-D-alanine carboxypeptidase
MKRFTPAPIVAALLLLCATGSIAVAGAVSFTHEVDFKGDPPGGQILLVDHGRIVYEKNFGVRDLQTKQPVDEHTRFEIGSITKQFAAAAILQLQESGKLSLDDPLGKYVPQYATGKHVTIKQLLWQVSGIPDYTGEDAYWKHLAESNGRVSFPKPLDLPKVLALVGNHPLRFKPGTKWEYSNTNYYLLGAVVEGVSGLSWEEYVRRNIYARLEWRNRHSCRTSGTYPIWRRATRY